MLWEDDVLECEYSVPYLLFICSRNIVFIFSTIKSVKSIRFQLCLQNIYTPVSRIAEVRWLTSTPLPLHLGTVCPGFLVLWRLDHGSGEKIRGLEGGEVCTLSTFLLLWSSSCTPLDPWCSLLSWF